MATASAATPARIMMPIATTSAFSPGIGLALLAGTGARPDD
jgi:hypothetical protein